MINLKYQTGYDLDEYIQRYKIANQIDEVVNLHIEAKQDEADLIERLTLESIFVTNTLMIIDAINKKFTNQVQKLLDETNYHIILINSVSTKDIVQTPAFSPERKNKKTQLLEIDPHSKSNLLTVNDRYVFENEIKKAKILKEEYNFDQRVVVSDEYITKLDEKQKIQDVSNQQINNIIRFYKACWYFYKYPSSDDVTLGAKININPKVLYYYRKEYKKLNAKKASQKIYELIDWQILCRSKNINETVQKILFKKIIDN
jgi:hypothetical protein